MRQSQGLCQLWLRPGGTEFLVTKVFRHRGRPSQPGGVAVFNKRFDQVTLGSLSGPGQLVLVPKMGPVGLPGS